MKDLKIHKNHCLNSISFPILISIVFISESVSFIMSLLILIMTSWNYLKKAIKTLNIICLSFIAFIIILNIFLFCSLKNIKQQIFQKYTSIKVFLGFLIIFYLLIIAFNIYDATYLSLRLHIADYPEYGGRKRDQKYIDDHPEKFGNVPLKEFIFVSVCPSVICVLNLCCIIICILIRNKLILTYNKEKERIGKNCDKEKSKNKSHKKKKRNSKNNINLPIQSNDELINTNNTAQNDNNNNINNNGKNEIIKIKVNNSDDGDGYVIKLPKKYFGKVKFDTTESINNDKKDIKDVKDYIDKIPKSFFFGERKVKSKEDKEEFESKEYEFETQKKMPFNSMQDTKSSIGYKNNK